ncbi:MAG: PAS domain-containing protein [Rhodospirillaceae bacterium]|jgi:hypothetical protein|nr:PAS domain-containing protein [Rhodospirillaceae bacterium]
MKTIELSLSDLKGDLDEAYRYWDGLRGDAVGPSWAEFDLMAVPLRLVPTTMVYDIAEPYSLSVLRFWGSGMTEIHGRDMTGKQLQEMRPETLAKSIESVLKKVAIEGHPVAHTFEFISDRDLHQQQSLLRLPLSNDRMRVSQVVTIIDSSAAAKEELRKYWQDLA